MFVEALLILLILTLGWSVGGGDKKGDSPHLVSFKASADKPQAEKQAEAAKDTPEDRPQVAQPHEQQAQPAPVTPPVQPRPAITPPPLIPLSRADMAAADIRPAPRASSAPATPSRGMMGPPDSGPKLSDTARVGTAPNGEPLYAAAWYREPSRDELDGYLSTATGPGWGLIACRTAPEYRVEDCVMLDEYPTGSNIARAALAAAWQFLVRPPRIGGRPQVGEWVRIRIDYGLSPAKAR